MYGGGVGRSRNWWGILRARGGGRGLLERWNRSWLGGVGDGTSRVQVAEQASPTRRRPLDAEQAGGSPRPRRDPRQDVTVSLACWAHVRVASQAIGPIFLQCV